MSEDDRNLSKDAFDQNQHYSENKQPYQNDPNDINDEEILRKREEKHILKEKEDFNRDKVFYSNKNRKKTDEMIMIQKDSERDYESDKRIRKPSIEIARETTSGNL